MLGLFRRRTSYDPQLAPSTAPGYRIYAIGDIHGQIDLLRDLLSQIERDSAARPSRRIVTILLGDLIDRATGGAALLATLAKRPPTGLVCLLGNHEAALVDAYDGNLGALALWLEHGGRDTLIGFGADPAAVDGVRGAALLEIVRAVIPWACITWLRSLPLSHVNGDYFFVHAGIRPGRRLSRQRRDDLLWIRDDFLGDDRWHGKMIVHGHTPSDTVEQRSNRIGIDTGAYATGRLSAIGLQDDARWVIQT